MSRRPKRGISKGTIGALALTALVVIGLALVLPRLTGNVRLTGSQGAVVLTADGIPVMEIRDIPLLPAAPSEAPTQAPAGTVRAETQAPEQTAAATAKPKATEAPTDAPDRTLTLLFGGTVAMETDVRQSGYYQEAGTYDFAEIMAGLRGEISADLSLVSLENLVYAGRKMSTLVAPAQVMDMLKSAGFDTVALGFPKAYQYGHEGVASTLAAARDARLKTVGLYASQESAVLEIRTVAGVRVALLHYTDSVDKTGKSQMKKDGHSWALPLTDQAEAEIRAARREGAEVIVVSLRWGASGKTKPTAAQQRLAQTMADAGADLIVGTGSRRVQETAWLTAADGRQVLCAYSIGSLLEDSRDNGAVQGLLLKVALRVTPGGEAAVIRAETVPTFTWRFKQEGGNQFRVIAADRPAPDGMDNASRTAMEKALERLRTALDGGAVSLR